MTSLRSHVEHLFRVIKRQFDYAKTRYRRLAKNAAQVFTLMGLTNLSDDARFKELTGDSLQGTTTSFG